MSRPYVGSNSPRVLFSVSAADSLLAELAERQPDLLVNQRRSVISTLQDLLDSANKLPAGLNTPALETAKIHLNDFLNRTCSSEEKKNYHIRRYHMLNQQLFADIRSITSQIDQQLPPRSKRHSSRTEIIGNKNSLEKKKKFCDEIADALVHALSPPSSEDVEAIFSDDLVDPNHQVNQLVNHLAEFESWEENPRFAISRKELSDISKQELTALRESLVTWFLQIETEAPPLSAQDSTDEEILVFYNLKRSGLSKFFKALQLIEDSPTQEIDAGVEALKRLKNSFQSSYSNPAKFSALLSKEQASDFAILSGCLTEKQIRRLMPPLKDGLRHPQSGDVKRLAAVVRERQKLLPDSENRQRPPKPRG